MRVKNAGVITSVNEVPVMDRSNQELTCTQGESSSRDDAHELHNMLDNEIEQGPSRLKEAGGATERMHAPCGLGTTFPSREHPSTERSSRPEYHDIGKVCLMRDIVAEQDLPPPLEASTSEGFPDTTQNLITIAKCWNKRMDYSA
jgi:hypothetical protein